jgi:hypothetical protein
MKFRNETFTDCAVVNAVVILNKLFLNGYVWSKHFRMSYITDYLNYLDTFMKRLLACHIVKEMLSNYITIRNSWTNPVTKLTNSVAPESEGSSQHLQQPANDPYPEPGESTPHPHLPIYDLVFQVVLILRTFPAKPCTSFSPLPCMPHTLPTSLSLIWPAE